MPALLTDEHAFRVAVDAHGAAVYRFARSRVGAQEAEDVTAETFAVAWANRLKFTTHADGGLEAWLIGIAKVVIAVHRRREERWSRMRTDAESHHDDRSDGVDEHDSLDRLDAARITERTSLDDLLQELPEREREPFLLHVLHGHTYEEIAERLGVPLGTVRSRISRGRGRLRRLVLLALMVLLILTTIIAVIAGARGLRARFGDLNGAANHARVLRLGGGEDLDRHLLFDAPYRHPLMERVMIDGLWRTANAYDQGEAVRDELRTVVDGDVTVYVVPTTRGYLCYAHWFHRGVIGDGEGGGSSCAREFTKRDPIKFGMTTTKYRRVLVGVMSDDVTSLTIVFADGTEQPVTRDTNAFVWVGPKVGAVILRVGTHDGTSSYVLTRSGTRRTTHLAYTAKRLRCPPGFTQPPSSYTGRRCVP